MDQNSFHITPIGTIFTEEQNQYVELEPQFLKGLKYLSMFSHAIIIYQDDNQPNIWNTCLSQNVVRLKETDEKQGRMVIEGLPDRSGRIILYDIKPYFPNEDRVKSASVPSSMENKPADFCRSDLTQLGTVRKIKGCCFLEIADHFERYAETLQGYSHIRIIWWFHKFDKPVYRKTVQCDPPYENAPKTGVFASRSPVRPNPIAMTAVRITSIDRDLCRINISPADCFDGTPMLGISPYIPEQDAISEYRLPTWLDHWPEWVDDREFTVPPDPILQKPAFAILPQYMDDLPDRKRSDRFFKASCIDHPTPSYEGIVIKGACQNNLKNLDVTIPYGKTTVITGVSGSGKSSLAFDTLYAESQQRFFASLSQSERSQFHLLEKPKFSQISGLPPAIAISQQNSNRNPRSTVGTATDLNSLLRALYAGIGVRHCPECGRAVVKMTVDEILEYLKHCRKGTIQRVRPFCQEESELVLMVPSQSESRFGTYTLELENALRDSLSLGGGAIQVQLDDGEILTFQTTEKCYYCDHILFEMTVSDFSFNNAESMCPVCSGLGEITDIDASLIIKYPERSLLDGASPFWGDLRKFLKSPNANWMKGEILALADDLNLDLEIPWKNLPETFRNQALYGTGSREVTFTYHNKNGRTGTITRPAEGACHILKRLLNTAGSEKQTSLAEQFLVSRPCTCCKGERLKLESRLVTIGGTRFPETIHMSMEHLRSWVTQLPGSLNSAELDASGGILQELYTKLSAYLQTGLGYLTLDRTVPTLSGGEWQRLQLVSQLGSGLSNILYILDEPTAGLHPKDYGKLMDIINNLKALHNTVVIVEHAPAIMVAADYIIDIGPKAGISGGYLTAQGTPDEIMNNKHSETGLYLSGKKTLKTIHPSERNQKYTWVTLNGVTGNNLQNIDVRFPINAMTCITGVSGSGKSSLVHYGILPAVQSCIDHTSGSNRNYSEVTGAENISGIVHITQKPIGRSSRSTPATYTGIMDEIRSLFARTEEAVRLGYSPGKFSYNSKEGQCPVCHGYGYKTSDAAFMPSVKIECPVCKGSKFQTSVLQILYKGKNIAEILDMSISDAAEFLKGNRKLENILNLLNEIGLGYLTLGQSSQTLSGGEAQRIKLSAELHFNNAENTLYLLDEPTTGLHFSDIQNLLNILEKIIARGNTVVLVEHNLDVIRNADWIIDLGPDGGDFGGWVTAQGTAADIMECGGSHTGRLIKADARAAWVIG